MPSNLIYTREFLKEYLKLNIYDINENISSTKIRKLKFLPDIIQSIYYFTVKCLSDNLCERVFWILNDFDDYPKKCFHPQCNNKITQYHGQNYPRTFCCSSCNSKYQLIVSQNPFAGEIGILRRKEGMIRNHGVDHNMKLQICLEKRVETFNKNYGVNHPAKSELEKKKRNIKIPESQSKRRATNEKSGAWVKLEDKSKKEIYYRTVWYFTNKNNLNLLENYHLRNHSSIKNSYSLDHKYSISEGFKNNIPPYIIGNIANLEFIPISENSKKNSKCSISLDDLCKNLII